MSPPAAGGTGDPAGPGMGPELARAAQLIGGADRVVVVTGAGVSAESGVPTFRGEEGLWRNHRPEELATPEAFRRDPRLVWEWYQWRRSLVAECSPNPAHRALAELQVRQGAAILTQNVDGLHALALEDARAGGLEDARAGGLQDAGAGGPDGPVEAPLLEVHGSLFRIRCTSCPWKAPRREPVDASAETTLPRCPECGALARPDVVWFGEALDPAVLEDSFRLAAGADVCLVVGTSAVVQPAASLPLATRRAGGTVVEVNPRSTPLTGLAAVSLRGPAGAVLPQLLAG